MKGGYTPEEREERFRWMRERQALRREIAGREVPARPVPPQRHPAKRAEPPAHLEFFRVNEVAEMLRVSRQTVERWFRDRAMVIESFSPSGRPHRTLLISRAALEEFVREHTRGLSA